MNDGFHWRIFFMFWPERSIYFSPEQSFGRNDLNVALGKWHIIKVVCKEKIINVNNFYQTKIRLLIFRQQMDFSFRPKEKLFFKNAVARAILSPAFNLGALPRARLCSPFSTFNFIKKVRHRRKNNNPSLPLVLKRGAARTNQD